MLFQTHLAEHGCVAHKVSMQQQVASQNIRIIKFRFHHQLVILQLAIQQTHGLSVTRFGSINSSAFSRGSNDLRKILNAIILLQESVEGIVCLVFDVLLTELL